MNKDEEIKMMKKYIEDVKKRIEWLERCYYYDDNEMMREVLLNDAYDDLRLLEADLCKLEEVDGNE